MGRASAMLGAVSASLLGLAAMVAAGQPAAGQPAAGLPAAGATASPQSAHGSVPGPYVVEAREVSVSRPDGGGDFEARLFIPLAPGSSSEAELSTTASPVVAFGHGYLTPVGFYESTLEHLASWGITTIAPRSGGELRPDHAAFADDLSLALEWVAGAAAMSPDWPGLEIDPEARGVSGHSMGGGAAVLAAARDPRIRTVATLAAADTRPSAIEAAAGLTVPALFVAASTDAITPLEEHQRPMFEAATGAAAVLRIIEGGSHCGFLDDPVLVGVVCDEAAIDGAEQLRQSREALVDWFLAQLTGPALEPRS